MFASWHKLMILYKISQMDMILILSKVVPMYPVGKNKDFVSHVLCSNIPKF